MTILTVAKWLLHRLGDLLTAATIAHVLQSMPTIIGALGDIIGMNRVAMLRWSVGP